MQYIVKHHRPVTLWLGMYGITAVLFWIETGNLTTGLVMGLVSASLKTVWSLAHQRLFGSKPCQKCTALEEGFATTN